MIGSASGPAGWGCSSELEGGLAYLLESSVFLFTLKVFKFRRRVQRLFLFWWVANPSATEACVNRGLKQRCHLAVIQSDFVWTSGIHVCLQL